MGTVFGYQQGGVSNSQLADLLGTIFRITYYEDITAISGTITPPQGATIILNNWPGGLDALVSKIVDNRPNYENGGVTNISLDTSGNYLNSGAVPTSPAAFIYVIEISLADYNLYIDRSKIIDQIDVSNEFTTLQVGDVSGGNYTNIESDGSLSYKGDATRFDDLLNNASSFAIEGDRPPIMKYFINDGGGGVDNARSFNGTSDYGIIDASYVTDWEDTGNISINIWLKPDDLEGQILFLDGMLDLYFTSGNVVADWGDVSHTSSVALSQNAWSMITVTLEDLGTRIRARLYINGVENKNTRRTGNLGAIVADVLVAVYEGDSWYNKSVYDELFIVNKTLSQENIDHLYNAGIPESLTPTILLTYGDTTQGSVITEATDVLAYFQFNESGGVIVDNNSTLGAGEDMILNVVVSIVTGVVGNTGSKGIALPHWSPILTNEVHIIAQTPHARKDASDFLQHVHALKVVDDTGWICMALEYTAIGLTGILPNTTIVRSYILKFGTGLFHQHCLSEMDDTVDGSSLGISSTFTGRLYRDVEWENANDGLQVPNYITGSGTVLFTKYNHDIVLLASDAHMKLDSDGSREPYLK